VSNLKECFIIGLPTYPLEKKKKFPLLLTTDTNLHCAPPCIVPQVTLPKKPNPKYRKSESRKPKSELSKYGKPKIETITSQYLSQIGSPKSQKSESRFPETNIPKVNTKKSYHFWNMVKLASRDHSKKMASFLKYGEIGSQHFNRQKKS